jgi:hypothetical protein
MSFNICRGTLGSLAMFTAIGNASSRASRLTAQAHLETADGWDLWGDAAFALRLGHKITVERYDHAKQCFFRGLHSNAARGKGLRTALDAL